MSRLSLLAIFCLLSLLAPTLAQQPTPPRPQPPPAATGQEPTSKDDVVRISVTLVQVDVVVTDRQGRQVTDLRPEEFEILEDNRPQPITNFSYVASQPASTDSPAVAARPAAPAGTAPVPPARLRPEQVRRTVALVVDDLGLSFESTVFVRRALKKFVDEQMQPGDLVAIIRTGAGIGALQQFTSDKRHLYSAIERVRWNMLGRGDISAFAPIGQDFGDSSSDSGNMGSSASDRRSAPGSGRRGSGGSSRGEEGLSEFREELFSVGTLGALNYIVRGLRDLPGRKSVILLSDGFSITSHEGNNTRILESLRRLTDLANRASVVVYTIDARGLQTLGLTAADDTSRISLDQIEERLGQRRSQFFDSQEGLGYLSRQTGGLFIKNSNDIGAGIKRVLEDQRGYYLIGYVPEETTFKAQGGRRNFHKITVKVKRPGLQVRSRSGFYGFSEEEARPVRRTANAQLYAALTSPFTSGDVRVRRCCIIQIKNTLLQ